MWLVKYFKNTVVTRLKGYPIFWIGLGWLLFAIASIVAFGFSNLVAINSPWYKVEYWFKIISNYLLYLSFIPAFLSSQKTLRNIASNQ